MSSRWRSLRRVVLTAVALAAGVTGCEVLVPSDVPDYACTSAAGACPSGQVCFLGTATCVDQSTICGLLDCPAPGVCDPTLGKCVGGGSSPVTTPSDGGTDASVDSSSAPPTPDGGGGPSTQVDSSTSDTTSGDSGLCGLIGCRCAGPTDCLSNLCAGSLALTTDVVGTSETSVCTQGCCTSADCGTGNVCFAAATGGNYCVNATLLGRTVTARSTNAAGAACSAPTDCASGLCSDGICVDTCCSATSCATGTACVEGAFAGTATFDHHQGYSCQPSKGTLAPGASCQQSSQCISGLCASTSSNAGFGNGESCVEACRNSAECGAGFFCTDLQVSPSSNDVIVACASGTVGKVATGGACTKNGDCLSDWCDSSLSACRDTCVSDSDCAGAPSGWHCAETMQTVQGGGSFSVLACGP